MKLTELESQDFINKFTETIIDKAKKGKQKLEKYTIHFKDSNYLANINLKELIFTANNVYHLWILVYKYMLENSTILESKFIITSNIEDWNLTVTKIQQNFPYNIPLNMANYKEFISLVHDNTSMDDVVDEVVDNFFNNNIFYAKKE
jgi:hypothetical protein